MAREENEGGKMSLEEAGRKGGQARAEKYSKEELSEQAKRAAETVEKERPGFHAQIGREGGKARGGSSSGGESQENRSESESQENEQQRSGQSPGNR